MNDKKQKICPLIDSLWSDCNGEEYKVIAIANKSTSREDVVYQNIRDKKIWTTPVEQWSNHMSEFYPSM